MDLVNLQNYPIEKHAAIAVHPDNAYIGSYVKKSGLEESKWTIPGWIYGRKSNKAKFHDVCHKYGQYIIRGNLYFELDELMGKTLLCWCVGRKHICHGQILIYLCQMKINNQRLISVRRLNGSYHKEIKEEAGKFGCVGEK